MAQGLELTPQDRMLLDSLKDLEGDYKAGKITKAQFLARSQEIMEDVMPDFEPDSDAEETFENNRRS